MATAREDGSGEDDGDGDGDGDGVGDDDDAAIAIEGARDRMVPSAYDMSANMARRNVRVEGRRWR